MNEWNEWNPDRLQLELAHTYEIIQYAIWFYSQPEIVEDDYEGVEYQ